MDAARSNEALASLYLRIATKNRPRARWAEALSGAAAIARSSARRAALASPLAIAASASAMSRGTSPRAPPPPPARVSDPRPAEHPPAARARVSPAANRALRTEQPPLLEARIAVARDDDVVEKIDPEDSPRFEEAPRDGQVLLARSRVAGRVVVRQHDARRGHGDRRKVDLARVHDARVQAPDRDDLAAQDLIPGIQVEADEVLAVHAADIAGQLVDALGTADQRSRIAVGPQAPPQLRRGEELRGTGAADAPHREEVLRRGLVQPAHVHRGNEPGRRIQRGRARAPASQEHRDQLRVGENARAQLEQPLARTLRWVELVNGKTWLPLHA